MEFWLNRTASWLVVAVAVVLTCSCSRQESAEPAPEKTAEPIPEHPTADRIRGEKLPKGGKKVTPLKSKRVISVTDVDEREDLAPTDRETLKMVEKAMEDENLSTLRKAIPAAVKSPVAEVRSETVDALGWFGAKAMDDLLPFLADADADIAESALSHWTTALGEIEDEKRKCAMVESVMRVLKNGDSLETLVMELNDCEQLLALQSVVNLIQCDNPDAVKVAREHYEFMTGDPFTTLEAANAWAVENCSDE